MAGDRGSEKRTALSDQSILKITSLVVLTFAAILLAVLLWLGNVTFNVLKSANRDSIPPVRWLSSTLIPLFFGIHGLRKKSLSKSGFVVGYLVGFILTLGSYHFLACLIVFFVSSSKATKFRSKAKRKFEEDFKEGGQRNWLQVVCNGGMASLCALLYIIDTGCGERPIDFNQNFRGSSLSLAVLGAFATANGDTWASELGTVLSKSNPWLITSFKEVPKGVNGGVSMWGLLVSLAGGMVVGLGHLAASFVFLSTAGQWQVVPLAATAGLLGSLIDSLLGATLQFSGVNKNGIVVERPGPGIKHISGVGILDNHCVNLLTTVIMAYLTPRLAFLFWPL